MGQLQHQWATFYSPRNGRISIQACHVCGIFKGVVVGNVECTSISREERDERLRGWTTEMKTVSCHALDTDAKST